MKYAWLGCLFLGSLLFAQWGWMAVTGMATLAALAALATRLWPA